MGKGQALYEHAKTLIPGGTQLLSKRPEMFLPGLWPAYYARAKGCQVWDLDGNEYADMSYMGIGSNVLGYAFDPVDQAARAAIDAGGMCTLNAPEEVELAELLLELHPWADMARYAKAGGEGMSLAVRVARAATGKDIVLFCGYHGWHDWYLSANLQDGDSLSAHLLKGLEPNGVPRGLAGTCRPFLYNDIQEFRDLVERFSGEIAAVVMEPVRNDLPVPGFLEEIRETTRKQNIVLVFDEITAGFRLCCGGSHLTLGVEPDMAIFAKAMTNGYPLAAVIGRREVMNSAQGSFISSTFWTERIGPAAAIAAVRYYREHKVHEHLTAMGEMVKGGWRELAERYRLPLHISGIAPLAHFDFQVEQPLVYKTFFIQEMLGLGYLSSNALYLSNAHSPAALERYLECCGQVIARIAELRGRGDDLASHLKGEVCHSGFQRLN